jgi:hypothetical protein
VTLDRTVRPRCNIGPAEVGRRQRTAIVISALTAIVAAALAATDAPTSARLAIFPFATAAGITWAQVAHRFCVAFGALGIENFGRLGEAERVDSSQRSQDRRRAAQLVLEGAAVGCAVTLLLVAASL